jgi:hypothetical protein
MPPKTSPAVEDPIDPVMPVDEDLSKLDRGDDVVPEPVLAPVVEPAAEPVVVPEPGAAPEPEPEPAAEPGVEPAVNAEPAPPKNNIMVTKRRLDDEIAKRRRVEAELELLRNKVPDAAAPAPADVDRAAALAAAKTKSAKMLRDAAGLVLDGKLDEAAQLQAEAYELLAEGRGTPAAPVAAAAVDAGVVATEVQQRLALDTALSTIYADFPVFNPDSPELDQDLLDQAMRYERMYAAEGHTPAVAVTRAVEDALKVMRPDLLPASKAAGTPPPAKPPAAPSLEKKVALANAQPPDLPATQTDKSTVDVATLSNEEYDALPESVKARLRGDF